MVELTNDEAESLAEHLEFYLIQNIRDDVDFDNINCLCNLVHVYDKCKAVEGEEDGD